MRFRQCALTGRGSIRVQLYTGGFALGLDMDGDNHQLILLNSCQRICKISFSRLNLLSFINVMSPVRSGNPFCPKGLLS